ncbi:MAG: ArsA family ATPase [Candidatus Methanomethylicia archaeon]
MEGLSYLNIEKPRIVMFCGKGGVGKTTCASATALHFAKKGFKTLLLSTDPTPSLSDILEVNVKGEVTRIPGFNSFEAVELDYDLVVRKWIEKFGSEVYEVVSSFLPVDREIIDYVAGAPGIDEEFALSYVLDFYKNGRYDIIVWDTAPAGGTISLINLQDRFYRHLGEAARLYIRVRKALDVLVKGRVKRDPLEIISSWEKLAQEVLDMLRNDKTHVIIVTIAEALGVKQTERIVKELKTFGLRIGKIVINYVSLEEMCRCSFHKKRFEMQRKYLKILEEKFRDIGITIVPQLPEEVKGLEAIEEVSRILFP